LNITVDKINYSHFMNYTILTPTKPKIVSEEKNKGTYEIENLYPGYGHTLGNSLRRIIHSSVPGVSVTAVSIEGVPHEFSTMDGVVEDVMTIILNLKRINFQMIGDDMQTVTIEVKGEKVITAKDVKCPSQITVMNEDQHIATLSAKNSNFKAEITLEKGIGYASKESRAKNEKTPIGTIVLDADFTPIRRVKYDVENMRVGDRTDYNRLIVGIETDGSITPKEALSTSINIMIAQLEAMQFTNMLESKSVSPVKKDAISDEGEKIENSIDIESEDMNMDGEANTKIKVDDLPLSSRTINTLLLAGVKTVAGLLRKTEDDIMSLDGIGAKAVEEIKDALANLNLDLKAKK
jgi:DNA-directed RNA polymerase subunit alpha